MHSTCRDDGRGSTGKEYTLSTASQTHDSHVTCAMHHRSSSNSTGSLDACSQEALMHSTCRDDSSGSTKKDDTLSTASHMRVHQHVQKLMSHAPHQQHEAMKPPAPAVDEVGTTQQSRCLDSEPPCACSESNTGCRGHTLLLLWPLSQQR
jgi:hypothetical protein